jgi:hypothetical protein
MIYKADLDITLKETERSSLDLPNTIGFNYKIAN